VLIEGLKMIKVDAWKRIEEEKNPLVVEKNRRGGQWIRRNISSLIYTICELKNFRIILSSFVVDLSLFRTYMNIIISLHVRNKLL